MSLELWYFKVRGRGEQVRLLLALLGVDYQMKYVGSSEGCECTFDEFKKKDPKISAFGSVPSIVDGNFRMSQGPAILAYISQRSGVKLTEQEQSRSLMMALAAEDLRIKYFQMFGEGSDKKQSDFLNDVWKPRWGPNLEDLLKEIDGNGFVKKDQYTFGDVALWDSLNGFVEWTKGIDFENLPRLKKFYDEFKEVPNIKKYLESDKRLKG